MSLSPIQIQNQLKTYINQKGHLINNTETAIKYSSGKTYLIYTDDKGQITNATRKEPNDEWIETVNTFFAKMFETWLAGVLPWRYTRSELQRGQ